MAETKAKEVKGFGRGPRGPKPKVENPGKLFARLMKYVGKKYKVHCVLVLVCIFVNTFQ